MGRKSSSTGRKGFTLIEVISVVAILAVVMLALLVVLKPQLQIAKSQDSRRKADVLEISKALEDYLNDHPCYPDKLFYDSVFSICGGTGFRPYLSVIPCDPKTKEPYKYEWPECSKYAVYANLETENLDITYGGRGNFAVSSSNYRLIEEKVEEGSGGTTPEPTSAPPSPTLTQGDTYYGCFSGICRQLSEDNCAPKYLDENCYDRCGSPAEPKNECGEF